MTCSRETLQDRHILWGCGTFFFFFTDAQKRHMVLEHNPPVNHLEHSDTILKTCHCQIQQAHRFKSDNKENA